MAVSDPKQQSRLANSTSITQIATGLIFAIFAFLAFALDKRELGTLYYVLLITGVTLLVLSTIFGGRGIGKIDSPGWYFEGQALCCLAGFVCFVASIFVMGKPAESTIENKLSQLQEKMGSLSEQIRQIESSIDNHTSTIQESRESVILLSQELKSFDQRILDLEGNHDF